MMNRPDLVPDEALVEAARRGDRDAAALLYDRHIGRVNRICYRILLDPSQVQDCVQDVWLKVFGKLDRFRRDRSFVAWLNAVAANTARDCYRKWARDNGRMHSGGIPAGIVATSEDRPDQLLDEMHVQKSIDEALKGISVNQRTAFVLRYYEGAPVAEIARVIGCSEGAVRTHIHRSLVALRTKLVGQVEA